MADHEELVAGGASDDLTEDVTEFDSHLVSDLAAEQHADTIRHRRLNRVMEEESATFAGVLVSLAERRTRCVITLNTGWSCRGTLSAVGADVVVVINDDQRRSLVRISSMDSVAPEETTAFSTRGPLSVTGDRPGLSSLTFESALRDLFAFEASLALVIGTCSVPAPVQWLGTDVAMVRQPRQAIPKYVHISSIVAVITE